VQDPWPEADSHRGEKKGRLFAQVKIHFMQHEEGIVFSRGMSFAARSAGGYANETNDEFSYCPSV
jgi:hypothetical protein